MIDCVAEIVQICRHHWCSGVDWNSRPDPGPGWDFCHHWCSGVDWNEKLICLFSLSLMSPLMQWCGLKCHNLADLQKIFRHHWCSGVDWNLQPSGEITVIRCHHWCSGVDWNGGYFIIWYRIIRHHWCSGVDWNSGTSIWTVVSTVTTDAVVWIEILIVDNLNHLPSRPPLIQ